MQKNNPDDFPELILRKLERWAKFWVEKYQDVPIERIVLHEYRPRPESKLEVVSRDYFKGKNPNSQEPRYVVVFEVPGLDTAYYIKRYQTYKDGWRRYGKGKQRYSSQMKNYSLPWKDLICKMNNIILATIPEKSYFIYNYNGFEGVYQRSSVKDDFYRDWLFEVYPSGDQLPHKIDDACCWVLWDGNKPTEKDLEESTSAKNGPTDFPQEVIDHVRLIKPSVIAVYESLKYGEGWDSGDDLGAKEARMNDALYYYDENHSQLNELVRKALEDPDIYNRGYGQDKRDIVSRIIKRSVDLKELGQHSARNLYKI